ncbi:MAG: MSHA fimbrial biogenesis protein MshJ [Aliiglaciecola sp.]|uniref:type 4a pilus biogenesis protein PilO n=1 Tax=Aliiglaciecola sp. M165 TaxID=2593649 RepID=UPI001180C2BD|nr:type 4a pilus biogenesis protein PilO [Aliiglaciecola sp. M165]TRY33916.1 MSHA biogenesis protein MshJ [Aliiglaciecola sp. M165]
MSAAPVNRYEQLQGKFIALTERERVLTLVALLSLILLGGYVLFVEPSLIEWDKRKAEVQRQTSEITRLDAQLAGLTLALQEDPNAPIKARLENLKRQISEADTSLAQQTEDLVPAHQMPTLLENVFAQFASLKLMEMRSIAPTAMLVLDDENSQTDVNLYQHGVQLTLQGTYFDIQQYLQRVEALPYQFYWKKFTYEVEEYPNAQVTIEIYTLSTSRAFIGVWSNE